MSKFQIPEEIRASWEGDLTPEDKLLIFRKYSGHLPTTMLLAACLGTTRAALSRQTGISLSSLMKWDAGNVMPRIRQIGKLVAGSPVTPEEFIDALHSWRTKNPPPVVETRDSEVIVKKEVKGEPQAVPVPPNLASAERDDWEVL